MKATKSAIAILRDMGFQTVVCSPFRDPKTDAFGDLPSKPLLPELKGADLVITLGGDGTILHLAKLAALHKIPMLGINMGGLGFLAELEVGSLNALCGLKNWDFPIEERMMLDVSVLRDGKQIYTNMGLNDAVIREGPISHVIHLKVFPTESTLQTSRETAPSLPPPRAPQLIHSPPAARWWSRWPRS